MKIFKLLFLFIALPLMASAASYTYSVSPEPGQYESIPNTGFELTFSDQVSVVGNGVFSLSGPSGNLDINVDTDMFNRSIVRVRVLEDGMYAAITKDGVYTLSFPAGSLLVGGEACEDIELVYTIGTGVSTEDPGTGGEDPGTGGEDPGTGGEDPGTGGDDPVTPPTPVNDYDLIPAPGVVSAISQIKIQFNTSNWKLEDRQARFKMTCDNPDVVIPAILTETLDPQTYCVSFGDDAVLTAPGTYTLTMPEGRFAINGKPVPEQQYIYIIPEDAEGFPAYTVNPTPGDVESISDGFTLTFDTEKEISVNGTLISTFDCTNSETGDFTYFTEVDNENHTVKIIPVDSSNEPRKFTVEGEYSLSFGVGAITIGDDFNPAPIHLNYYVTGYTQAWDGQYTADPEDGAVVESLHIIDVLMTGASRVKVSESAGPNDYPQLYKVVGGSRVSVSRSRAEASGLAGLRVTLNSEVTSPGEYVLVIPSTLYRVNGMEPSCGTIELSYSILSTEPEYEFTYEFTPSEHISFTEPIVLTFDAEDLESVKYNEYSISTPRFSSADGYFCPSTQVAQIGPKSIMISHSYYAFENEGDYVLTVPNEYITLVTTTGREVKLDAFEHTFHVSAQGDVDPEVTGDINGDGEVDSSDLATMINIITGNDEYMVEADLNDDGEVDSSDLAALINLIIGAE